MINWKGGEKFLFLLIIAAFVNMAYAAQRDYCVQDPIRRAMSAAVDLVVIRRKLIFVGMIAPIATMLIGIFADPGGIWQFLHMTTISSVLAVLVYFIYRQWPGPVLILDGQVIAHQVHVGVRGIQDIRLVGGHLEITTREGVEHHIDMSGCYAPDILLFIAEVERRRDQG